MNLKQEKSELISSICTRNNPNYSS